MLNDEIGVIVTNLGGQCKIYFKPFIHEFGSAKTAECRGKKQMVDRYGYGDVFSEIQDFVLTYLKS